MTTNDAVQEVAPNAPDAPQAAPVAPRWLGALGLVAGLGAVVASSCCVIPLALTALGVGAGVLGGLETVAEWRVPLLSVSGLAIVGGWSAWLLRRRQCEAGSPCATANRSGTTLALLLCASVILLAAASWSYIDPAVLKLIRGR